MAGIAGVACSGKRAVVNEMLEVIKHRGGRSEVVVEHPSATLGQTKARPYKMWLGRTPNCLAVCDGAILNWRNLSPESLDVDAAIENLYMRHGPAFLKELVGPFALAIATEGGVFLARDCLGASPLYLGTSHGVLYFASEIKALVKRCDQIKEFPPGTYWHPKEGFVRFAGLPVRETTKMDEDLASAKLRSVLSYAIAKQVTIGKEVACWLSGGLDSSTIASFARQQLDNLMTFSIGFKDAPDLAFAREVANALGTRHNEVIITPDQVIESLPATIYHLESFDAPLVRSAVANFLLAKATSCHADSVLSGEGADEIFGGYQYFQDIDTHTLAGVLADAINNLHNTALQRIDRCAAAFGLMVLTPFLDNQVLDYALSLPVEYKVRRNGRVVGKWILRKAVENTLPPHILNREKAKFWEGTGITQLIERYARDIISDQELSEERILPDGSILRSKEELLYFRIFREQFGEIKDLSFVGRTSHFEQQLGSN